MEDYTIISDKDFYCSLRVFVFLCIPTHVFRGKTPTWFVRVQIQWYNSVKNTHCTRVKFMYTVNFSQYSLLILFCASGVGKVFVMSILLMGLHVAAYFVIHYCAFS